MVVQDPLGFNLLLGKNCVYAMNVVESTLFRVMSFPHDGKFVAIDQISFFGFDFTANHPTSQNILSMQVVSPSPQVNYVTTYSMLSPTEKEEPVIVCSTSSPFGSLDIFTYKRIVLPYDQTLLESMASWGT